MSKKWSDNRQTATLVELIDEDNNLFLLVIKGVDYESRKINIHRSSDNWRKVVVTDKSKSNFKEVCFRMTLCELVNELLLYTGENILDLQQFFGIF